MAAVYFFHPPIAFSYGDSSSLSQGPSPYSLALDRGTVQEAETEAIKIIEMRHQRELSEHWYRYLFKKPILDQSSRLREFIAREYSDDLVSAVLAGNVEVTQWLLDNGANPTAPWPSTDPRYLSATVYSSCEKQPNRSIDYSNVMTKNRRIEAYSLTIRYGGKIDTPTGKGYVLNEKGNPERFNPMYICTDPDLLELFLKSGVPLKKTYLDVAIRDALSIFQERKGLLRAEFFFSKGLVPSKRTQDLLNKPACGEGRRTDIQEVCKKLRTLAGIN